MQGNILGQSAGINIHGIIEEYKVIAGENVSAGDFVEFVNNYRYASQIPEKSVENTEIYYHHKECVKLEDNQVLMLSSNIGVYLTLFLIEENRIICQSCMKLCNSGSYPSITVLDNKKFFCVYSNSDRGTEDALDAVVCSIKGNEITVGVSENIGMSQIRDAKVVTLDLERVLVAYASYHSGLHVIVCKVNEMTIEKRCYYKGKK